MKEFSKEVIEIGGKEYTLFLNRKGIIAYEKYAKDEQTKAVGLEEKYKTLIADTKSDNLEIKDDTNPFEGIESLDDMDEDHKLVIRLYKKLYWIMLYENHKLSFNEVSDLFDMACEDYGEENIIALGNQMIEEANKDNVSKKELKNLKALKPRE